MNLFAPDLLGTVEILIASDWQFRVILPKVEVADRRRLVQLLFDAAQLTARELGISVSMKA